MRSMIDRIKSKYTDIAIACFPELAEMYERIGFVMCEADGAQVAMRIGNVYEMNKILPGKPAEFGENCTLRFFRTAAYLIAPN